MDDEVCIQGAGCRIKDIVKGGLHQCQTSLIFSVSSVNDCPGRCRRHRKNIASGPKRIRQKQEEKH